LSPYHRIGLSIGTPVFRANHPPEAQLVFPRQQLPLDLDDRQEFSCLKVRQTIEIHQGRRIENRYRRWQARIVMPRCGMTSGHWQHRAYVCIHSVIEVVVLHFPDL